jgi:hypothetical protein
MPEYLVRFTASGYVHIEAQTEAEALDKAINDLVANPEFDVDRDDVEAHIA